MLEYFKARRASEEDLMKKLSISSEELGRLCEKPEARRIILAAYETCCDQDYQRYSAAVEAGDLEKAAEIAESSDKKFLSALGFVYGKIRT